MQWKYWISPLGSRLSPEPGHSVSPLLCLGGTFPVGRTGPGHWWSGSSSGLWPPRHGDIQDVGCYSRPVLVAVMAPAFKYHEAPVNVCLWNSAVSNLVCSCFYIVPNRLFWVTKENVSRERIHTLSGTGLSQWKPLGWLGLDGRMVIITWHKTNISAEYLITLPKLSCLLWQRFSSFLKCGRYNFLHFRKTEIFEYRFFKGENGT